ncbi:protein kinase C21 [Perkinsela sp. CCAP 1560/4]|nr:protein kinase C21 [Perkinsela sp. CCAP 1560/4]|eukprot:KNH08051.1 protein kinase C21 [Perkinsela sp. CCAP 1560/4]
MKHDAMNEKDGDPRTLFQIENLIGRGQSSTVYRARVKATNQEIAIKIIEVNECENVFQEMQHEIRILESCTHPNIVQFYGAYFASNALWIVMELCEGSSIEKVFKTINRGLYEEEIAHICLSALQGLSYIHTVSILHRDVKCSNMLLTKNGELRLSDFGVSTESVARLSQRNSFRGSISWMAPEVLREQPYDDRADIWSLGISAVEMAECSPPHITLHPMYSVLLDREVSRPGLSQPAKWSSEFVDFVDSCLQSAKEQRPTAEMLLNHPWFEKIKRTNLNKLMSEYFHQVSISDREGMSLSTNNPPRSASKNKEGLEDGDGGGPTSSEKNGIPFISLDDISFSAIRSSLDPKVETAIDEFVQTRSELAHEPAEFSHRTLQATGSYAQLLRSLSKHFLFSRDIENDFEKAKTLSVVLEELMK